MDGFEQQKTTKLQQLERGPTNLLLGKNRKTTWIIPPYTSDDNSPKEDLVRGRSQSLRESIKRGRASAEREK
jgi:hypothetical protein